MICLLFAITFMEARVVLLGNGRFMMRLMQKLMEALMPLDISLK